MVEKIHYRWDFIGLSTDTKPTPATNDRVTNGSTFYCSDNSKLYVWYKDQWYEKTVSGGGGTSNFNELSNRPKYNGVVMTDDTNIPEVETYSDFTGTDGTAAGASGLVPAPATTDAGKFLKADGTWDTAGGGVTPVQTTGTSTTDVMSQNATTSMVFADPATQNKIKIGSGAGATLGTDAIEIGHNSVANNTSSLAVGSNAESRGENSGAFGCGAQANSASSISIGYTAQTASNASYGMAIGSGTVTNHSWSVALGAGARTSAQGELNIGTGLSTTKGYNSSNYRLISGVYDGQNAHDAATVGQINATIDAINTALSTSIPHIGATS